MRKLVASSVLTGYLVSVAFGAASVLDYKQRVAEAAEEIEGMKLVPEYGVEAVGRIKKLLPAREQVEMDGQTIATNNTWLHILLDSYNKERNEQQRRARLDEAAKRLRALEAHLERVESPSSSSERPETSVARERLREILARPEYQEKKENPLAALVKKVRRQVVEFLQDLYNRIFTSLLGESSEPGWIFRLVIILLLAAAAFLVIRMAFKLKGRRKVKEKPTVLGEEIEPGTTSADLASAALAAAGAGDFRIGVRKLYIAILYELAERNLIELESNATNHEYLAKVSRFKSLVLPMAYLTDRFDYIWYGMFPSSKEDFSNYLARYREAVANARTLSQQSA